MATMPPNSDARLAQHELHLARIQAATAIVTAGLACNRLIPSAGSCLDAAAKYLSGEFVTAKPIDLGAAEFQKLIGEPSDGTVAFTV